MTREIYQKPTVKQVIFQIKFPNLFYIENKMGDFQFKIMSKFPKSNLAMARQILFANVGPKAKINELTDEFNTTDIHKIWQFFSPENINLNITLNSLDITSEFHKSYDIGEGDTFRKTVQFCVDALLEIAPIPKFDRIGLRYIDECPIPQLSNASFQEYYNTTFPLDRFDISRSEAMDFRSVTQFDSYSLQYIESLQTKDDRKFLILDFDGFSKNVDSKDYLKTTDKLHEIIYAEYEKTIKEPLRKTMRGE